MGRELSNGYAGTFFFQIVNIGDDIDQNRFMSHSNYQCS